MRKARVLVGAIAVATAVATLSTAGSGGAAPSANSHRNAHSCTRASAGNAACTAIRHETLTAAGKPVHHTTPSGYFPADIQSAYQLAGLKSGNKTVAIVDAYDDPKAEADLGVYRSQFGLPACTTANGCFRKVDQNGGTNYPSRNGGWAEEISLDVDMVSATCPDCRILLVEARSASFANLSAAVNYASSVPGVVAISNSYGGSDSPQLPAYNHPGIAITASTGDAGYGVESPASFTTVVAVGGTTLKKAGNSRGWSETAWAGAGSGCSTQNAKPSWQTSATRCSGKANADVSAVADPNTGVAVYDSFKYQGYSGWLVFGGTSVSSPIIASVYALSGNTSGYPASYTWGHAGSLNDVTSGSNGSCPTTVWCTAGSGWDGPTGLGTPRGTSAF
ncbi:MAG: S53 family peptidase [Mycobacteriales bacterium]